MTSVFKTSDFNVVVVVVTESDIRMIHYVHVILMCLAAAAVCWGLALMWQADVIQQQCDGYLWLVYLPASFLVHLNNIKAYRLSTFMKAGDARPKPFSHGKVLRLTFYCTLISMFFLVIASIVDPPTRSRVQVDQYRAKLDYYYCKTGIVTPSLMYILVVGHIIASLCCIITVRNGMDAFKDGMIIKESFMLLYVCLLVAFVLQNLGLSPANAYMLRSVILSMAVTFFLVRLMIGRCLRHWIPERVLLVSQYVHAKYISPLISDYAHNSNANASSVSAVLEDADGPLYALEQPQDNNLDEMMKVFTNPARGKLFYSIAKKALVSENVDFITAVLQYRKEAELRLVTQSSLVSDDMQKDATKLYKKFIVAGSDSEVNISSKTRSFTESALSKWILNQPLTTVEQAQLSLHNDSLKRYDVFEPAMKEISIMLYQNLWNKFRSCETENFAAGNNGSEYSLEDM